MDLRRPGPGNPTAHHIEAEARAERDDLARACQLARLERDRERVEREVSLAVRYSLAAGDLYRVLEIDRDLAFVEQRLEWRFADEVEIHAALRERDDPVAAARAEEVAAEIRDLIGRAAGLRRERTHLAGGPSPAQALPDGERRHLREALQRGLAARVHRAYATAARASREEPDVRRAWTFRVHFAERLRRALGTEPAGDPVEYAKAICDEAFLLFTIDGEPRLARDGSPLSLDDLLGPLEP